MATSMAQLRFRGTPKLLEGLAPLPFEEAVSSGFPLLNVKLSNLGGEPEALTLQASRAGESVTRLKLAVPDYTPPGTYEGSVTLGATQYPALVEVEANPRLIISPGRLRLSAAPGAEISTELTVTNAGNVPFEIERVYKPGLLDVKGPERAIGLALIANAEDGHERVGFFAEELARSHAGQIELVVQEGAGTLPPGEYRLLHVGMRLPSGLQYGRVYGGTWMLLNRTYYIEVHVSDESGSGANKKAVSI